MKKALVPLIFLFFINNIFAQNAINYLQQGNQLYKANNYDSARLLYKKIYENQNTNKDKADALYNAGNTYAQQSKWQEAIDYYKKSLKESPESLNAKYNLTYAQKKLAKQQEQQQQKNDKDKNKDKQKQPPKPDNNNKDNIKDKDKQNLPPQNQPQKSSMSKEKAEQLLNALKEEEKKLMKQKEKGEKGSGNKQKDW